MKGWTKLCFLCREILVYITIKHHNNPRQHWYVCQNINNKVYFWQNMCWKEILSPTSFFGHLYNSIMKNSSNLCIKSSASLHILGNKYDWLLILNTVLESYSLENYRKDLELVNFVTKGGKFTQKCKKIYIFNWFSSVKINKYIQIKTP